MKERVIHPEIRDGSIAIGFLSYQVRDHEVKGLAPDDASFPMFREMFGLKVEERKAGKPKRVEPRKSEEELLKSK